MTDDLNPQGPAQPSLDQAYETKGNAATKEPLEENLAQKHAQDASLSKVTYAPPSPTAPHALTPSQRPTHPPNPILLHGRCNTLVYGTRHPRRTTR